MKKCITVFGEVGKGIHSYRVFDIAIVDVLLTFLVAFLISKFGKFSFYKVVIILFVVGVIAHRVFRVNTKINKMIFGELECE